MTVYVDDLYRYAMGAYRGMRMSHMIADTDEELHAMADAIGLKRRWFQGDHYDVSLSLRRLAVSNGAVEITWRDCGVMVANKRAGWPMGNAKTCYDISRQRVEQEAFLKEVL